MKPRKRFPISMIVAFSFFAFPLTSQAKPLGYTTVRAKVISYDSQEITAEINKKRVKLPRSVITEKKFLKNVEREIHLTPSQLTYLKLQYFKKKPRKK